MGEHLSRRCGFDVLVGTCGAVWACGRLSALRASSGLVGVGVAGVFRGMWAPVCGWACGQRCGRLWAGVLLGVEKVRLLLCADPLGQGTKEAWVLGKRHKT